MSKYISMKIVRKSAIISKDKKYRYQLMRHWDKSNWCRLVFLMVNPSTADYKNDDPTIKSCCRIANYHGYGGILVINLFAWRSRHVEDLYKVPDPVGPENDFWINRTIETTDRVLCAWGGNAPVEREGRVMTNIGKIPRDIEWLCLGENKNGTPKHPLFCKAPSKLLPYDPIPF